MPKKKRKPRHQPAVSVAQAFRGLMTDVVGVLTDQQFDIDHGCKKPERCAICKCTRTIRNAYGPAEAAVRQLEGGELRLVLDCTTAHLPAAEAVDFAMNCPMRVTDHEHGWMVFLGDEVPDPDVQGWEDFPVLHKIVTHAIEVGCGFINFDTDGGHHDGLEVYEW